MRLRSLLLPTVAAVALVAASARPLAAAPAKSCSADFVRASLSWGVKCLHSGEFCKVSRDIEYHRYRFHCHTGGRLTRRATPQRAARAGCEPGYSPCLPRVADLNCGDIPAAKRPVRVTGSDPYRLDRDGDGSACE